MYRKYIKTGLLDAKVGYIGGHAEVRLVPSSSPFRSH